MILNTHPDNRKEMVKAISELNGHEAIYKFIPTYAYEIGPITVNKDGTIQCDDLTAVEQIRSMLIERGWLDDIPAVAQTAEAADETAEEMNADEHHADDENSADEDSGTLADSVRHMELTMPLRGWMPMHLTNLIRILYSRQRLINRMMQGDMLFIAETFAQSLMDNPIDGYDDFEARMKQAIEAGEIRGISFHEGKFSLHAPFSQHEPTRWVAYSELLTGIMKLAQEAKHIHMNPGDDPENEKYHANTWLMRMGFAGARHKEMRRILMRHLNGFAAFKNADAMQRHKEKYAQMRKEYREAAGE